MQHVILETDSQIMVKALRTEEYDRASNGVLFREAKFLMSSILHCWSFWKVIFTVKEKQTTLRKRLIHLNMIKKVNGL